MKAFHLNTRAYPHRAGSAAVGPTPGKVPTAGPPRVSRLPFRRRDERSAEPGSGAGRARQPTGGPAPLPAPTCRCPRGDHPADGEQKPARQRRSGTIHGSGRPSAAPRSHFPSRGPGQTGRAAARPAQVTRAERGAAGGGSDPPRYLGRAAPQSCPGLGSRPLPPLAQLAHGCPLQRGWSAFLLRGELPTTPPGPSPFPALSTPCVTPCVAFLPVSAGHRCLPHPHHGDTLVPHGAFCASQGPSPSPTTALPQNQGFSVAEGP